jgi:hypothetical protein
MAAMVPLLIRGLANQSKIGLVHQGGGLERLTRLFLGHPLRGELAKLVIDQGQELLGGEWIAPMNLFQNPRHFIHRVVVQTG